ncbi:tyrosine-protein phosphatase non-receptor type substrate 1-like isoform X1 [Echeneis naucrates]|uniref:tyrosine-protein phosphatase non-receptor type substrate 1-like isoform X1 n=1 Tax=Echeneis naucrates TaxID=173247 RepID=UPI001113E849|nr:tyrosine-protein phosphatase non-receptor type substrate 1-like isoform X1 [Echeneis naucrates]
MSVNVSMSASWRTFVTILYFACAALSNKESSRVQWKKAGEPITIQCRSSERGITSIQLSKGLHKEVQIYYRYYDTEKFIIDANYKSRIQLNVKFPNTDFLISNLTPADTGPYWCVFKKFESGATKLVDGNGSVLLVVAATSFPDVRHENVQSGQICEADLNSVLLMIVVAASVLLGALSVALICIYIKTRKLSSTVKPRRVTSNDVYEDMRAAHSTH